MEQRINFLFSKYLRQEIQGEEFDELLVRLINLNETEMQKFSDPLRELWEQAKAGQLNSSAENVNWEGLFQQVINSDERSRVVKIEKVKGNKIWLRAAAAAIIVFSLLATGYLFLNRTNNKKQEVISQSLQIQLPENILPGNKKATLTLSNGKKILLNDAANGTLALQGGAKVIKLDSGQLMYRAGDNKEVVYNLISTERAAEYQVILPDGSRVWLNSSSSLRFPTIFTGNERSVELTGEAYFEVAKNAHNPFRVKVKSSAPGVEDMVVEVLGTHFNIMAYANENAIKTTLLEGLVKVKHGNESSMLQPGKQAQLNRSNGSMRVLSTNVNIDVAWKNGYFYFDKADVKTILRQVSRWYDLDITNNGTSDLIFSGKIERNLPLSGILHLLELSKIHLKIEGKNLTVLN